MKVRSQILLLLMVIVGVFVAGILVIKRSEKAQVRQLADARTYELNLSFDRFLHYWNRNFETFASERFTDWDGLVRAAANRDREWCAQNLNEETLRGYETNAVWLYSADLVVLHACNNIPAQNLSELPLPRDQVFPHLLTQGERWHFFLQAPQGLMEIYGIALRPSWDSTHEGEPTGYFFAGRLWNNRDVEEMGLFTNNTLSIVPASQAQPQTRADEEKGVVTFERELAGWDSKPVARLLVKNESPIIYAFRQSSERLSLWMVIFACLMLLTLALALRGFVSKPLQLITRSMHMKDLKRLAQLKKRRSEIGQLAALIEDFFQQRDELIRQTEERRAAESALRKSEEQLRQSQKMEAIGLLAGGVAHDFNNLLTAIIGYADLLAMRMADGSDARQKVSLIQKAGNQAAALTRQLLAFSRKQLLEPRVFDLNALVLDMEKLLRRIIGEHIELRSRAEAQTPRVKADPNQIEQVVLNLAVNARDAMPDGGVLTICTVNETVADAQTALGLATGEYVALVVTDSGVGMDAETQRRMFEPFFTTKGVGKGTGLGLSTVYGIVRQSGGAITVESQPGRGTTFKVYFPATDEPAELSRPAPTPVQPSQARETVLVVEDEEVVRELVCEVLKEQQYHVLSTGEPNEALGLARTQSIQLLITDMVMPGMNGDALAQAISADSAHVKVLYISGYSDQEILQRIKSRSSIEMLPKPFTPDALARKVREVLTR